MLNKLKAIQEAIKTSAARIVGLRKEKQLKNDSITTIFENCENLKQRHDKRITSKDLIEKLNSESLAVSAEIEKENLLTTAYKETEKTLVSYIVAENLLKIGASIDGKPLHYKKLKDAITAAAPEGYSIYINSYYGYIDIDRKNDAGYRDYEVCKIYVGELAPDWHTKTGNQSQYNFNVNKLARYANAPTITSPLQAAAVVENYIKARRELKAASDEYNAKCKAIEAAANNTLIDWNYRLDYIVK